MSLAPAREQAVSDVANEARRIIADRGVNRASLDEITGLLAALAMREELFSLEDFPPPPAGEPETLARYLLREDVDRGFAMYLMSMNPGKSTKPHNHTTWATIAAIEGEELNRIYARIDDGSDPERAQLKLGRELVVQRNAPIAFMPDDIHSIHITGQRPTRHLHLYGYALETLSERKAFDLETGRVVGYNSNFMVATKDARNA